LHPRAELVVSADALRETLAKVDDGDTVKQLMAATTFEGIDESSQSGVAELYGFSSSWGLELTSSAP
jgi:hypothetical protein